MVQEIRDLWRGGTLWILIFVWIFVSSILNDWNGFYFLFLLFLFLFLFFVEAYIGKSPLLPMWSPFPFSLFCESSFLFLYFCYFFSYNPPKISYWVFLFLFFFSWSTFALCGLWKLMCLLRIWVKLDLYQSFLQGSGRGPRLPLWALPINGTHFKGVSPSSIKVVTP